MKKRNYSTPSMRVVEIPNNDIIATSDRLDVIIPWYELEEEDLL